MLIRNTAIYYYHRLRLLIFDYQKQFETELFEGKIEVDESYFGGVRKGRRGRDSADKTPVFGLLKRGGKLYTKVTPKVIPDSIVYSDSFKSPEGSFELEIPRDRDGSFSPQLIKKHQTRVISMDEQIIALYSKGMTK